jgi:hypothetical protein
MALSPLLEQLDVGDSLFVVGNDVVFGNALVSSLGHS